VLYVYEPYFNDTSFTNLAQGKFRPGLPRIIIMQLYCINLYCIKIVSESRG